MCFCGCGQLRSVTLPQTLDRGIGCEGFLGCSSLISIIIPESMIFIGQSSFHGCSSLQMIALSKHISIEDENEYYMYDNCNLLHGTKQPNITNWLQTRFDDLPLHQIFYSVDDNNINSSDSATTDKLASIQVNDKALIAEDAMGMTPLHVLCCNPFSTADMIKQLVSKNQSAAHVRNNVGMTPLHIYLIIKNVISHPEDLNGFEHDIHKMIDMGLEYEIMDLVLAFNGRCIEVDLSKENETTGLYPFMSGLISDQ